MPVPVPSGMFFVCDICFLLGEDRLVSHVQYTMRQKSCILAIESITLRRSHLRKSYLVGLSEVGHPESISHQEVPPQLLCFICTSIALLGLRESWDMSSDGPSEI